MGLPVLQRFLQLLYPPKCVLCGRLLEQADDLCPACRRELETAEAPVRSVELVGSVCAPCRYEGAVRQSILRYKFRDRPYYADVYGKILAAHILKAAPEYDLISWIPVSAKRRRKRGYDQAQLLAQAAAKMFGTTAVPTLKKQRDVRPQSELTGEAERRANVAGVYRAVYPERFAHRRVLLIDDILTTGATMSEAAKTLLFAGAAGVCAAVFAVAGK